MGCRVVVPAIGPAVKSLFQVQPGGYMFRVHRGDLLLVTLLLSAMPRSLTAQDTLAAPDTQAAGDTLPRLKPALGASVDRFVYDGYGITAVSFRYSGLKPNSLSTEIGAALFPDALQAGALLLAPDVGAAYDVRGAGFDLLFKGGISTLMGLGGGGFAFQPGYHLGSGLLIRIGETSGIRLDVVRHAYLIEQETELIWSVGIGVTSLPRSKP
jgi:hypothetical protein